MNIPVISALPIVMTDPKVGRAPETLGCRLSQRKNGVMGFTTDGRDEVHLSPPVSSAIPIMMAGPGRHSAADAVTQ